MIRGMIFILIMSLNLYLAGQDTLLVSLSELKEELLTNNIDILLASNDIALRQNQKDEIDKNMLPSVSLNSFFSVTNTPLNAFGTRLQQARITQSDFAPDLLNNPDAIGNLQVALSVAQPIINLDMRDYKKAANLALEASKMGEQRTREAMINQLEQSYLQLIFLYELKEELNNILNRAQRGGQIVGNARTVGYAFSDDVLEANVRIEEVENQIFETDLNISNLSAQIRLLCRMESEQVLRPNDALSRDSAEEIDVTLNDERSDFQAASYLLQSLESKKTAQNRGKLPRLNAFLSYEANLNKVIDGGSGYLAGLQLSWNIYDGQKTNFKTQESQIQYTQQDLALKKQKEESERQLAQLQNNNRLLKAKIRTTQSAIEQAEESLRIAMNRYQEGLEKTSDLIMKEITLSERSIRLLQLYFQLHQNGKTMAFIAG